MSNPAPLGLNLQQFPEITPEEGVTVIGDLHDNPMKLIYSLIRSGKLKGLTAEDYQALCKIYYDSEYLAKACYEEYSKVNMLKTALPAARLELDKLLEAKANNKPYRGKPVTDQWEQMANRKLGNLLDLESQVDNATPAFIQYLRTQLPIFMYILKKCQPMPELSFTFRLIGDEQFDRGYCGVFTRAALKVLTDKNMDWDVNLSNHGVVGLFKDRDFAYYFDPGNKQAMSGITMYAVEDHAADLLSTLGLDTFMNDVYLPRLKLGSYLLRDNGTMDIDYHAPVDQDDLFNQAEFLGIPYKELPWPLTHESRAALIDAISDRVRDYAIAGRLNEIMAYCDFASLDSQEMVEAIRKHNPINYAIWNRSVKFLSRPAADNVRWRHGHERVIYTEPHLQCIDSAFGKGDVVEQNLDEKTQVYVVAQGRPAVHARAAVSIPPRMPVKKRLLMELHAEFAKGEVSPKFLCAMIEAANSISNLVTLRKRFIELKEFPDAFPSVIKRSLKLVDDELAACTPELRLIFILKARVEREFGHYKAGTKGRLKGNTLRGILEDLEKKPDLQLSDLKTFKVHGVTLYKALNIQRGFFKTEKANSLKRVERETDTTTMRSEAISFLKSLDRRLMLAPKSQAKRKEIKKLMDALLSTTTVINSLDDLCNLRAEAGGKTLLQVLNMHRYKEPAEKTTKSYEAFCRHFDVEEMLGTERVTAIRAG